MISNKIKLMIAASVFSVSSAFAGSISGSPHDLSANISLDSATADNGEICVYCHTPHAANTAFTGAPLWNKATPTGTFTMYGSTIAGTATDATPASPSLACLSCHDGVSAIDSIVNAPGSGMNAVAGTNDIVTGLTIKYGGNIGGTPGTTTVGGPNLANDHPVSIVYTEGTAGLRLKTTILTSLGDTVAWVGASTIEDLLRGAGSTQVECGSCHDPHNGGKTQGTDTEVNFLRHTNTNSYLCLGCHDK
ncbi:MAG: cytochrome c3 family protein [Sulfurimonas sp.]|uniref:cytochrome c3 family protein n=1 Tax=Sulfurimonas sp. TaxID=2022749 RepID=UPI0028CBD3F8|nr:cytochrome c3 family protein [Sulfurimonas sp.]MDT8337667.1 cytochrome c3 family protein [Sulfurimonas sp.]